MKNLPYWVVDTLRCALIVAIGLLVIWLLFSVGSLFGPDEGSWQKVNIDWDFGAIVYDGDKIDATFSSGFNALYTKDLIKCTGYEITLSLPAGVSLEVYEFDANDELSGMQTIEDTRFVKLYPGDMDPDTVGIRLCMIPDSGEDFELGLGIGNLFKKWKYAGYVDLDITNVVPAT